MNETEQIQLTEGNRRKQMTTDWEKISLMKLELVVKKAARLEKHVFIWDKSGQVAQFFELFGIQQDFIDCMVKVAIAEDYQVPELITESLNILRDSIHHAASERKPLLWNLGMLSPDFNLCYFDEAIFPSDTIFEWESYVKMGSKVSETEQFQSMNQVSTFDESEEAKA